MIVVLDDILIYSKTKEEHEEHLRLVMQALRENQLYDKLNKCSFYQGRIHYLGNIIYEEGVIVDPKKIRAIMEWSTPKNVSKVRFLHGVSWIIPKVHRRILKFGSSYHIFVKERCEV